MHGPHFGLQSPITRTVEVALMRYSFSRAAWLWFLVSRDLLEGGWLQRNLLQLSSRNWDGPIAGDSEGLKARGPCFWLHALPGEGKCHPWGCC